MSARIYRPAWAEIDCAAIAHNVAMLGAHVRPVDLCAVVKADGYGHSAPLVAVEALRAGASRLAVALVEEGIALRDAGIRAPILLLSEPHHSAIADCIAAGITPTLYTPPGVFAARRAARELEARVPVHLKVDTGMHRVGADPQDALVIAEAILEGGELALEGIWTHLGVADDPEDPYTAMQLAVFDATVKALSSYGIDAPVHHVANSAGALAHPDSHRSFVRSGIALYGYLPHRALSGFLTGSLRPVLSLRARVAFVRALGAGERPSYGRIRALERDGDVAVVPLGYADGVPRNLGQVGGEVLIGGRRRPILGNVTMDQIIVDCLGSGEVVPGDEVTLLGSQGDEFIGADEWAERTGTIVYEILCAIGPRVPRVVVEAPSPEVPLSSQPSSSQPSSSQPSSSQPSSGHSAW